MRDQHFSFYDCFKIGLWFDDVSVFRLWTLCNTASVLIVIILFWGTKHSRHQLAKSDLALQCEQLCIHAATQRGQLSVALNRTRLTFTVRRSRFSCLLLLWSLYFPGLAALVQQCWAGKNVPTGFHRGVVSSSDLNQEYKSHRDRKLCMPRG